VSAHRKLLKLVVDPLNLGVDGPNL
jgi:hypothetical protein